MSKYFNIAAILLTAAISLSFGTLGTSAADAQTDAAAQADSVTEGWVTQNGKQYYLYPDGTYAVGETEIDGIPYLFGYSGALKTDWQTIGGKRYYYDPATGSVVLGWVDYFGLHYYVSQDDGKLTGFQEIDGNSYAFAADGSLWQGRFTADGTEYCSDPESGILDAGMVFTETGTYCTDADGILVSGWQSEDGLSYYIDETTMAALVNSFAAFDGVTYYFGETGAMATGWQTINNRLYYFDETGAMACNGWLELDGKLYYFSKNGPAKRSFAEIDGSTYYFNGSGAMVTGMWTIKGNIYYFAEDGIMQTGWITLEDATYYMDAEGRAVLGWYTVDEQEYYFQENGTMAASVTLTLDGYHCTFDENGILTSKKSAPISLDVPSYKQFDDEWGSVSLGSTTIKSSGCLVTAMAMLHSYTTESVVTPVTMKGLLSFTSGGALQSWSDITSLGYTVETYECCSISTDILQNIYQQLFIGKPVIVGCKNSSYGQHYVVVTGYTGDGTTFATDMFTINDPGSSHRFLLSEYLELFPMLYKLIY